MTAARAVRLRSLALAASCGALLTATSSAQEDLPALFATTFDTHWERLRDDYPYFELYGVDWEAEREEHRPKALAATDSTEFAWELARLFSCLPDPHLSYLPPIESVARHWSVPDVETRLIERRPIVLEWPEGQEPTEPEAFAGDPFAYPEIVAIRGVAPSPTAQILAAGPGGTSFDIGLRWPDGTRTEHTLHRPDEPNLPPFESHYGDRWLVAGRVGSIGYMRVKTFDPEKATLGPDGKMTTMLRSALAELGGTEGLILDLQANGGGLVAASDPFLGSLIERRISYRWGNSGGKKRVIRPRSPRYRGKVVAVVDERSASGGEWAARILRDAGRATVVGGRTSGAEAAVHRSEGPDGSVVAFSAWPMVEPGVTPFQETGIELDHALPLTIEDVRRHGLDEALTRIRRARFAAALEVLGASSALLDELVALADEADRDD